jgi:hypothetical protein
MATRIRKARNAFTLYLDEFIKEVRRKMEGGRFSFQKSVFGDFHSLAGRKVKIYFLNFLIANLPKRWIIFLNLVPLCLPDDTSFSQKGSFISYRIIILVQHFYKVSPQM